VGPFRYILEQHIEDASFLWVLRSLAVRQPNYRAEDITQLEKRIEANLDGIMTSLARAWPLCLEACAFEEGGEAFVLAVTAFRSLEMEKIKTAVEFGFINDDTFKGLVSALGWLPGGLCHDWIRRFLTSKELSHKYLALCACAVRSEDPGSYLNRIFEREDCLEEPLLYERALRAVGEFKRDDLFSVLNVNEKPEEVDGKSFWRIWSAILLGNRTLVESLEPFVLSANPWRAKAIDLAFRVLPMNVAKAWITKLAETDASEREVIRASAILGDPQVIPWLLQTMKNPKFARLAGEAFSMITGISIEEKELVLDIPDITEFEHEKDEVESVTLNEDEHLPWPDADRLAVLWQKYSGTLTGGQRYFMGRSINTENCKHFILQGTQRIRSAAAQELALLDPKAPFVNTEARTLAWKTAQV